MKIIKFIFVGKPQSFWSSVEEHYLKRISRYNSVKTYHIKDSHEKNILIKRKKESTLIQSKIDKDDTVILCDERGKSFSTKIFCQKLQLWTEQNKNLVFVIGGAYGVDFEVLNVSIKLKLSDFVMPHDLARIVLLEQVYRGFTILAGEKYHHE